MSFVRKHSVEARLRKQLNPLGLGWSMSKPGHLFIEPKIGSDLVHMLAFRPGQPIFKIYRPHWPGS